MSMAYFFRLSAAFFLSVWFASPAAANVTLFAASSLSAPIERSLGTLPPYLEVRTSYAGSQTLARQIEAGAPADIFISANQAWLDYLADKGLVDARSAQIFARNRLVAVKPVGAALPSNDLGHLLASPQGLKIAIGEPNAVPAGIYAKQSLEALNIWPIEPSRLIRAESVRTVLLWVERNEADVGFVYASDALQSTKVTVIQEIPLEHHDAILYPIVLVSRQASREAKVVFDHLMSDQTAALLEEMGFSPR